MAGIISATKNRLKIIAFLSARQTPILIANYFRSFIRFQTKKDIIDTPKQTVPKVSSLGQGTR